MPHDTPLIATIVVGLGLDFVFGAIANRFRIPPLVGYLIAGVLVGPNTPGFAIVVAFRYPIATALMISASLAQIGEFSFILAELGVGLKLLPEQGRDLILAGAILSIVLNPLMLFAVDWMKPWLEGRAGKAAPPDEAKPIGPATEPGQPASVAAPVKEDCRPGQRLPVIPSWSAMAASAVSSARR